MRRRLWLVLTMMACLIVLFVVTSSALAATPKRVLIVVMDQMRPEYAKQYNMTNVLWLENHGANFHKAYVGDMASETVVSHNVMVSGLFPKHMGWSDEAFRDTGNVLGDTGGKGIYVTGDLGYSDFQALVAAGNYPKLGTYLHAKYPGSIVACVGEKSYQVESMTAGNADIGVRMSSAKTTDPALVSILGGAYRIPTGVNVPSYIADDTRFAINSDANNDYGTSTTSPAWMDDEIGDRMVPGIITGHLGGDDWVTDATIKIMQNENWSGLFLNFGGIDKVGHMWGGGEVDNLKTYQWDPNSIYNQVHMPFIAKNADTQLGRLIGTLKALHEFNDTMIVVLADHGNVYAKHFEGVNAQDSGSQSYYGTSVNDGTDYLVPWPNIKPEIDTGNVAFSYVTTALETWLTDYSHAKRVQMAQVMRKMPGVIATYIKSDAGTSYVLQSSNKARMTKSALAWWKQHGQELVNTMAWSGSADVVGLLADHTGYSEIGDHGGAQKTEQRIPMAMYVPGMKHLVSNAPFRLVDVMPTIMRTMGLTPTKAMDGKAYKLPIH